MVLSSKAQYLIIQVMRRRMNKSVQAVRVGSRQEGVGRREELLRISILFLGLLLVLLALAG